MKKMISIMLLVALVLTLAASIATAESNPFGSKVIYCQLNAEVLLNNYDRPNDVKTTASAGKLYIRHYLYGDWGGTYTNHFRASTSVAPNATLYGTSWMMPDTSNYVTSASLKVGLPAYAWGRGNTNYGLSRIEITGYSDPQG